MFDLNEAIRDWRRRMSAVGLKTPEVLDELESHLRDDVEAQVRSGSTPEHAFELATERIGQPAVLGGEFNKVEGISKLKDAFLTLAGIPNQYVDTNMNASSPNLEPRWATYLKASGFLAPALFLWMVAAVFIIPKLQQICADAGLPGPNTLWDLTHANILTVNMFREYGLMIILGLIAVLVLLE